MDFASIKQFLADVDAAADKGVENSKRNAEFIHKLVAEASTLVGQLEQSGAVVNIVNTVTGLFKNGGENDLFAKGVYLSENNDAWRGTPIDQIKFMVKHFPETVEKLYRETRAQKSGGSWGSSTDTPS